MADDTPSRTLRRRSPSRTAVLAASAAVDTPATNTRHRRLARAASQEAESPVSFDSALSTPSEISPQVLEQSYNNDKPSSAPSSPAPTSSHHHEVIASTAPFLSEKDTFAEFIYKPHTLTGLAVVILSLAYFGFFRLEADRDSNIKMGLVAVCFTFLLFCLLQFRDSLMLRPHPAPWRIVTGCGVLYLLALVFFLFQTKEQAREHLTFFFPRLKTESGERSYASDCRVYTADADHPFANIWGTINDEFILAHILGYWGKAIMLRDWRLAWFLSVFFEVLEITFQHWMANFRECWWDHIIIDIFLCNAGGIWLGMKTCEYFGMKKYEWTGLKAITTTKGKFVRILQQFTPSSFEQYHWEMFSSLKRFIYIASIIILVSVVDLNAFFLKFILDVPPPIMINSYRVILWWLLALVGLREYYVFISDPNCKRLGHNAWLCISCMLVECMLVFKYGWDVEAFRGQFPPAISIAWALFIILGLVWTISYFYFMRAGRPEMANSRSLNAIFYLTIVPFLWLFIVEMPEVEYGKATIDRWFNYTAPTVA